MNEQTIKDIDKAFKAVDELTAFLTKLKTGSEKVIIGERPLYTDEYSVNLYKEELFFRGNLYHEDIANRAIELNEEITKSIEKFYRK